MNQTIKNKLASLPENPGSYQMLDASGNIIYVGKAKNLKSRVRSYFVGSHDQKTQNLISNTVDFTYLVTASELEAFLLELSLIKEHSPKYNIMLMDDKSYPYIEITNEKHPKLIITRKPSKKSKNSFGPFPDASSARETLYLLNRIFPLRKCATLPKKVCLYYHMGQCLGPCVYPVEQENYDEIILKIRHFLSGNNKDLIIELKEKMMSFSDKLEFEKAKEYKDILFAIERTTQKQQVIFSDLKNRDIIHYHIIDQYMAVTTLFMRQGKIIFSETHIFTVYDNVEESFLSYLGQFYALHPIPQEVLVPSEFDYSLVEELLEKKIHAPMRGDKMKLLEMAKENAKIHLQNNLQEFLRKHAKTIGALDTLGELLHLEPPKRIESFDNSNTMGKNPVSAMVVFTNGLPDKKQYRKYLVKTVEGADDFHTMKEVLYRRYQRMLFEQSIAPDLIIMDGGIIQVHAAKQILESLYIDIPVIGLKKDDKHHTDSIIDLNEEEIKLDRHSNLYILLTRIQDEVHRFAITFHRSKQNNQIYSSILDAVPGIGKVTKNKLLEKYKTIVNIKNASTEDLKSIGLTSKMIENLQIALLKSI
ncbi:MAG: excinuclease ABC subunit UvrC [Candidatus Izemoplasmatales bacterium]|nr:excinuclease ABC subunit UvrC [Candidatus Izemoplasmatales bacterium]